MKRLFTSAFLTTFLLLVSTATGFASEPKIIVVSSLKEALEKPKTAAPENNGCAFYLKNPSPYLQSLIGDMTIGHPVGDVASLHALLYLLSTNHLTVSIEANLPEPFFFKFETAIRDGELLVELREIQISFEVVQYLIKNYLEHSFTLTGAPKKAFPSSLEKSFQTQLGRYQQMREFWMGSRLLSDLNVWEVEKQRHSTATDFAWIAHVLSHYSTTASFQNTEHLIAGQYHLVQSTPELLENLHAPELLFDGQTYLDLESGKSSLQGLAPSMDAASATLLGPVSIVEKFEAPMKELRVRLAEVLFARKNFQDVRESRRTKKTLEAASLLFIAEWRFQEIFLKIQGSLNRD